MTMLAQVLKNNIAKIEAEKAQKALEAQRAIDAKIQARVKKHVDWVNGCIDSLTGQIMDGKRPRVKVKDYDTRRWIDDKHRVDQDVWNQLVDWAEVNGLDIVIKGEHDGVGMEDWLVVTVEPKEGV